MKAYEKYLILLGTFYTEEDSLLINLINIYNKFDDSKIYTLIIGNFQFGIYYPKNILRETIFLFLKLIT